MTLLIIAVLALLRPTAHAQGQDAPSQVLVVRPECALESVDVTEALRLFRVELVGDTVEHVDVVTTVVPASGQPGSIAIVYLRVSPCASDATAIETIIDDAVTRKRVRRTIDLGGVPHDVRPRALALGVAELLRASWAELARVDPLEPAVPLSEAAHAWLVAQAREDLPSAPPSEEPITLALPQPQVITEGPRFPSPPPLTPRILAGLAVSLRTFPADGTALLGARAGISFPLLAPLRLRIRIDGSYERGLVRVTLGDIAVGLAVAGLSVDLSSDSGDPFLVELGPRIEVGYGWASGTPTDPTDTGLQGGGIVALLSGHFLFAGRLADAWYAFADLEVGHTLAGLDATVDGRSTSGIAGPALGALLGMRIAL